MTETLQLEARCDDVESRSRRSNLLFFRFPNSANETWAESEKLIVNICVDKLGVSVEVLTIDRANHIGTFKPDKKRSVIA